MERISIHCASEREFADMQAEWNCLLEQSVTNEVFLSWEWIYSWWRIFKRENRKLYILIGKTTDNKIVGIIPFYIEKVLILNIWPKKIIKFCSSDDTYSDHLDIICDRNLEYNFLEKAFDYLMKNDREWDEIRLDGINENSIIIKYLRNNNGGIRNKLIISLSISSVCPYLSIDRTFKEYTDSFSRSKRRTVFRYRKLLLGKKEVEFKYARDGETESSLKELVLLHNERCQRRGIESTFGNESALMFHKLLMESLISGGKSKIVLSSISENSIPVASLYCIEYANKYYCYQSGVSYEGEKNSAGTVILSLNIEKAFDDGCKEVDFLRGNEKYKYFWTQEFRRNMSLTVRKNDLIGRLSTTTVKYYLGIKGLIKTSVRYGSNPISKRENHHLNEEGDRAIEEDPH